jgi:DNA (cytosine-5)-methyltransferase 1
VNELALFAGAGGGILGGHLLGWRTRCAVELDAYARAVLLQRQADGCLPRFPIWDDVRTFDGNQWRGRVQVVSGGFPCTDISRANANAEGLDGDKSGLWFEMARIIGEVRPDYALVENSPFLVGRGLERVVADLAELGYDARWGVLGAYHAGAPHARERIWIVAHAMRARKPDGWAGGFGRWIGGQGEAAGDLQGRAGSQSNGMWEVEPAVCGVASRVADKLDKHRAARLRGIGNGQVPAVAAMAWRLLTANVELRGGPAVSSPERPA